MSGCQKAALLVLVGAVVLVFWVLFQLVQSATGVGEATPTSLVLHTPTSTATGTSTVAGTPASSATPVLSSTPLPEETATSTSTPTLEPTEAPTSTPIPPTNTPQPSPTYTATPTTAPRPTVPAEVSAYLKDFTSMVGTVYDMGLLESSSSANQDTAEQLRAMYRQLHEMGVPEGAEEMHLAFVTAVSVLEEKCLCQVFAEAHGSDAQGQHYRDCVTASTTTATEVLSGRFVSARDAFLQQYSLTAKQAGFPG
jgi:cytoskeletal protein RodZ